MKNKFLLLLSLLLILCQGVSPKSVYAHSAGQIPFFKVNGVYSDLYPVPTSSLVEFKLPQDNSPATYLVGKPINFEIDVGKLPIPPEVVKITNFMWDFGDGEKAAGTLNTQHTYKKPGSYFLEVTAQTAEVSEPQLIQSNIVHVVPTENYKLPKSVIKVNGKGVNDPLLDTIKLEFGKDFELSGESSEGGSGKIVEYFWDLGDGKSVSGEKVKYQYDKDQYAYFPVLRVKDENGLISDSFLQVTNEDSEYLIENKGILELDKKDLWQIGLITLIAGGIVSLGIWMLLKKRSNHRSKY